MRTLRPLRLFIGNLDFKAAQEDVEDFFETRSDSVRVVGVQIMQDAKTSKPRGFGFVDVETELTLDEIVREYNGKALMGRTLTVNGARPRPERSKSERREREGDDVRR